jgi:hypothetical protein
MTREYPHRGIQGSSPRSPESLRPRENTPVIVPAILYGVLVDNPDYVKVTFAEDRSRVFPAGPVTFPEGQGSGHPNQMCRANVYTEDGSRPLIEKTTRRRIVAEFPQSRYESLGGPVRPNLTDILREEY